MQTFHRSYISHRISRHAAIRMQQRSIPSVVVDLLLDLTDSLPAGSGCVAHRFTADSWAEAKRCLGQRATQIDRYRNAYVVVGENGTVVTAARLH